MKLVELKGNIKSELEGNGLGGKFRFVNEKTYHITLYDLIWQGDGENKADVDKKIEKLIDQKISLICKKYNYKD